MAIWKTSWVWKLLSYLTSFIWFMFCWFIILMINVWIYANSHFCTRRSNWWWTRPKEGNTLDTTWPWRPGTICELQWSDSHVCARWTFTQPLLSRTTSLSGRLALLPSVWLLGGCCSSVSATKCIQSGTADAQIIQTRFPRRILLSARRPLQPRRAIGHNVFLPLSHWFYVIRGFIQQPMMWITGFLPD